VQPGRILIVDDDPNMLLLMQFNLEKRGHEVVTADNADHALELARNHDFELFLLDVMLPGRSGFELCSALRLDPRS
jgi:DNA-binding response OmpR family regulator